MKPLIITSGEPAGIGPDLCLQLADHPLPVPCVVAADPDILSSRAQLLGQKLKLRQVTQDNLPAEPLPVGELALLPLSAHGPVAPGKLEKKNAPYVLNLLSTALSGCLQGTYSGLVTAPVHKGIINEAGIHFTGHTEYLAAASQTRQVVMMLATEGLKVALATTHLPLKAVASQITQDRLTDIITLLHQNLRLRFGIENPHLLICGLNPHAGEGGHLGREELEVISPALERLRLRGLHLTGPLPADTLFTPQWLDKADAVVAMYHDQGLPVLKYKGFGNAVNITLGLPFIRTSVDHGTALDLAGTGRANPGSLLTAIRYAATMATRRPVTNSGTLLN
jgi:4-hydroxythreonine-4-phosphate dehydrogenase